MKRTGQMVCKPVFAPIVLACVKHVTYCIDIPPTWQAAVKRLACLLSVTRSLDMTRPREYDVVSGFDE